MALSLALAIVNSSPGPLLLLDGALGVVAMSASFAEVFALDAGAAAGRPLSALGGGEWDLAAVRRLLTVPLEDNAPVAVEIDLERAGLPVRRVALSAHRLTYLDLDNARLLLTACDVTEVRANSALKDEALLRSHTLLQEVRHRVANSLQIVASVLLQHARKTHSIETRAQLTDAHQRVMSVATLERQLSRSGDGRVELQAYFGLLCESIAASMIDDPSRVRLSVTGPESHVPGPMSVSLGLITTELIVNALKHAFMDGRSGAIEVDWNMDGANWTLCVTDNGIGMTSEPGATAGLGTGIVQALAKQLGAAIEISSAGPGTRVAITHPAIRLVGHERATQEAAVAAGSFG